MTEVIGVIKKAVGVIISLVVGILAAVMLLPLMPKIVYDSMTEVKAQKKKEETGDEIQKKTGAQLIAESDDSAAHMERIERERDDFRERVRNRFNQNLRS